MDLYRMDTQRCGDSQGNQRRYNRFERFERYMESSVRPDQRRGNLLAARVRRKRSVYEVGVHRSVGLGRLKHRQPIYESIKQQEYDKEKIITFAGYGFAGVLLHRLLG